MKKIFFVIPVLTLITSLYIVCPNEDSIKNSTSGVNCDEFFASSNEKSNVIYCDTIYPMATIVEETELTITYRFDLLEINEEKEKIYHVSNITIPIDWKDNMVNSSSGGEQPIEIRPFNFYNGKTVEEIFEIEMKDNEKRKEQGGIYEDLSLISIGQNKFTRIISSAFSLRYDPSNVVCSGWPHNCIYFGTFEDDGELYAWQAVFYLPDVDPEICVPKEVLEEQEKIISTFEVVGKAK